MIRETIARLLDWWDSPCPWVQAFAGLSSDMVWLSRRRALMARMPSSLAALQPVPGTDGLQLRITRPLTLTTQSVFICALIPIP